MNWHAAQRGRPTEAGAADVVRMHATALTRAIALNGEGECETLTRRRIEPATYGLKEWLRASRTGSGAPLLRVRLPKVSIDALNHVPFRRYRRLVQ